MAETYTPPKGYLEVKNIENIDPTMNEESNEDEIWLFRLPFGMDASMLDGVELPVNNEIPTHVTLNEIEYVITLDQKDMKNTKSSLLHIIPNDDGSGYKTGKPIEKTWSVIQL